MTINAKARRTGWGQDCSWALLSAAADSGFHWKTTTPWLFLHRDSVLYFSLVKKPASDTLCGVILEIKLQDCTSSSLKHTYKKKHYFYQVHYPHSIILEFEFPWIFWRPVWSRCVRPFHVCLSILHFSGGLLLIALVLVRAKLDAWHISCSDLLVHW